MPPELASPSSSTPVGPLPPAGDLEPSLQHQGPGFQEPEVTTLDFKPRRRRGPQSKIAQLPGEQRALVNQLLDEVVEEMARHGVSLTTDNPLIHYSARTTHPASRIINPSIHQSINPPLIH